MLLKDMKFSDIISENSALGPLMRALRILLVFIMYFATALMGLKFAVVHEMITLLWPPSGVALLAFFLLGRRVGVGIFTASLAVNLYMGATWSLAIFIALGNTLGPYLGAEILRRSSNFSTKFLRVKDVALFAFTAALLTPVLSASWGVLGLWYSDRVEVSRAMIAWIGWWIGDAVGILVLVPLVWAFLNIKWQRPKFLRVCESLILLSSFIMLSQYVFLGNEYLKFLVFPYYIWSAIRFRQIGVATLTLFLASISLYLLGVELGQQNRFSETEMISQVNALLLYLATANFTALILVSNINQREEMERRIQKANLLKLEVELPRKLIAAMPDGITVVSLDGRVVDVNPAFCSMTGFSRDEIVGSSTPFPYWPEEEHQNNRNALRETLAGHFHDLNLVFMRKGGERFPVIVSPAAIKDSSGEIMYFFGTIKDVSERSRVNEALRRSEARLRAIFDAEPECVKVVAPNYEVQDMNSMGLRILEARSIDEVNAHSLENFIVEEFRNSFLKLHERVLMGETGTLEFKVKGLNGTERWVESHAAPLRDASGQVIQVLAVTRDTTDRKKIETEFAKNQELLNSIIDSTPSHVFAMDVNQRYILLNNSVSKLLNLPKEQVLGKTVHDVFPKEQADRLLEKNTYIVASGETLHSEEHIMRKSDRSERLMAITKFPLRDSNGSIFGMAGLATDISSRKAMESELIAAKNVAENAAKIQSKFLDIAAHELRTPVTTLSALLELIQMQKERGQPLNESVWIRLNRASERLKYLVLSLLDRSKLDRGQLTLELCSSDLNSLVANCVEEIRLVVPQRTFKFEALREAKGITLDPIRIHQVLSNLLDNAVKYTPVSSPIKIAVRENGKYIRVSVFDQGPGISAEDQEGLFAAFSRGSSDATIRSSGLGLGLSVSREIVQLHGGRIGVVSGAGSGCEFYFELPQKMETL